MALNKAACTVREVYICRRTLSVALSLVTYPMQDPRIKSYRIPYGPLAYRAMRFKAFRFKVHPRERYHRLEVPTPTPTPTDSILAFPTPMGGNDPTGFDTPRILLQGSGVDFIGRNEALRGGSDGWSSILRTSSRRKEATVGQRRTSIGILSYLNRQDRKFCMNPTGGRNKHAFGVKLSCA